MLRQSLALTAGCLLAIPAAAQSPKPAFEFDHVWFAVLPGAPERAALERAGLLFASEINRHDGQGTASITVEFANVFFELIYPDSTVPVAPGRDAFARRLSQRVRWRTTGVAPFGFHVRRAAETPDSLPFPTWSVRAEWMPPGAEFANITPRTDTITPSFTVLPRSMGTVEVTAANVATVEPARRTALSQPLGLRRLTGVGLVVPRTYQMTDAMQIFQSLGAVTVTRGEAWCVWSSRSTMVRGTRRSISGPRFRWSYATRWSVSARLGARPVVRGLPKGDAAYSDFSSTTSDARSNRRTGAHAASVATLNTRSPTAA